MANLAFPTRQISLTKFGGQYLIADPRIVPPGASPLCHDCDFNIAEVGIRPGKTSQLSFSPSAGTAAFLTFKSCYLKAQITATILQDSGGGLWEENLDSPGTATRFYSNVINSARALIENVGESAYICLSDLTEGTDQPRQYDGTNLDRVSQVGPGSGPVVSAPTQGSLDSYPIVSIIEAWPQVAIYRAVWGANADPTDKQPGQLLTLQGAPGATNFTTNLQVGDIVYISGIPLMGTDLPSGQGSNPNGTYKVINVGTWAGAAGEQQIFQVQTTQSEGVIGPTSLSGAYYQITEAIVQTSQPVPAQLAQVGSQITIAGSSNPLWDGVWTIQKTPTEGQLLITATSLTSNVATYDYTLISGSAPGWQPDTLVEIGTQTVSPAGDVYQVTTPGITASSAPTWGGATVTETTGVVWTKQTGVNVLVTVFNTNNGGGIFNVQNAVITSATQTTFTVAITSANVTASAEEGEAFSGSGTEFVIDPGLLTIGTGNPGTSPIYGNATGGFVIVQSTTIAAGQRYAIVMFLTRSGYITKASPPVPFYTTSATVSLNFTNLPIGPANVIARIVAFTAADAGIGGPYFWIPEDKVIPASAATFGQTITYNKTIVNDNTSTSTGAIVFSDNVLTASNNVVEDGNNRLRIRELGECVKAVAYDGRVGYLGERTKLDNLLNYSFDGGSVSGFPAGWTLDSGTSPTLITSLIFGQSASFGSVAGTIKQTAYQDAFSVPIVQANTAYSVRVTAYSTGSPASLTISLVDGSNVYSFSPTLTTSIAEYIGAFSNPLWQPVPSDLLLKVAGQNCVVDRIEVFPTEQPVYTGQIAVSYLEDPESIDSQTGVLDISSFTSAPATNIFKFLDVFYMATISRTLSVPANASGEPNTWDIREVSNAEGCYGPMCEDVGEEYVLVADLRGVYVFDGGNHIKVSQEIQPLWDAIYWPSGKSIWIRNELHNQRILVGIPIPTPNAWIPDAPTSATPALPNWIEMMSYLGVPTGRAMGEEAAVHPSMFTGQLLWVDERRKWTPWQIAAPYCDYVLRATGTEALWLGGTTGTGKVYLLDSTATSDDGAAIPEFYMTYGFSDRQNEEQLQLGSVRKIYNYASVLIEGSGNFFVDAYPETPQYPYVQTQPAFALASPALDDTNVPLNAPGNRVFLAFRTDGIVGSAFSLKRVVLGAQPHARIQVSGV